MMPAAGLQETHRSAAWCVSIIVLILCEKGSEPQTEE